MRQKLTCVSAANVAAIGPVHGSRIGSESFAHVWRMFHMYRKNLTPIMAVAGTLACVSVAQAGFSDTMHAVSTDPASWAFASLVQSLDIGSTGYQYPDGSGYALQFGDTVIDQTDLISDVYRINSAQSITTGAGTVDVAAGSMVFAYRMTLVEATPAGTVTSLGEVQIAGLPAFGGGLDPLLGDAINNFGFVDPAAHGRVPVEGNPDFVGDFGGTLDWEWAGTDVDNLDNDDSIILLMFTDPTGIGQGIANLISPPGQPGGLTGLVQGEDAPPVLIPAVPAPGVGVVMALGGLVAGSRRRR